MLSLIGLALMLAVDLPVGAAPPPVPLPHFPDTLHAFVWRNWELVPADRMAAAIGATPKQVRSVGLAMGLTGPPRISKEVRERSYLTVIRRNWHLLPYDQLLKLLEWTPEKLAYTLREDDFLYIKLGSLKPHCPPVKYLPPSPAVQKREHEIAALVNRTFPSGLPHADLFRFVRELSAPVEPGESRPPPDSGGSSGPRFCYSYFALYGDPLLDKSADPYPEAYLQRLHDAGVNGVWLQGVLSKLAPFPWDPQLSSNCELRLAHLRTLIDRAAKHGIGIYLYLNEPRAMPLEFFRTHPELKGVVEGDHAALCTSTPEVQAYISGAVEHVCRAAPKLAGLFTITASENLTNCWSHGRGSDCVRCTSRGAATVIPEVSTLMQEGIRRAGARTRLIAWDWGWSEVDADAIIDRLPRAGALMSVSEWDLPIARGGLATTVGEYSLSAVGPGPRAIRHWARAQARGLQVIAKVQAANSWEMSAVPYVPAVANTARHAANLRELQLDGMMLGWTLGGYPSPNLEVAAGVLAGAAPDDAMLEAARNRFGTEEAPAMVRFWKRCSQAFSEFPFHIGVVYTAPLQHGPSSLLWAEPTGYHATMVGFGYDDLNAWRAVYPPQIFTSQLFKTAEGFDAALGELKSSFEFQSAPAVVRLALLHEMGLAETAAIHFQSVANMAQFIQNRDALKTSSGVARDRLLLTTRGVLDSEIALSRRLIELQCLDPRIGFEASNQYYYTPGDLMEKILNCVDLRDRWLTSIAAQSSAPR